MSQECPWWAYLFPEEFPWCQVYPPYYPYPPRPLYTRSPYAPHHMPLALGEGTPRIHELYNHQHPGHNR